MSLLTREPPRPIESLDELFALAHAMEDEAATRYAQIGARMRAEGNSRLADVFERLSSEERGHIEGIMQWSQAEQGREPDPSLVRWTVPETFDDEGIALADPRLLTAYRTLSMAVRNEERAFAFWTYVAAQAEKPEVRRAAEAMAAEELGHVATLRRERRRAFHAERSAATGSPGTLDAAELERHLAGQLDALAARAAPPDAARIRQFADEARATAEDLTHGPLRLTSRASGERIPEDAVALSELLVDGYLDAAEGRGDEQAVRRAQALAGRAINRLAWLRADLPELHPPA